MWSPRTGLTLTVLSAVALSLTACTPENEPDGNDQNVTGALPAPVTAPAAGRVSLAKLNPVQVRVGRSGRVESAYGSVWVRSTNGTVARVDPETRKVDATIGTPSADARTCPGLGVALGSVWVCTRPGELARIHPRTGELLSTVQAGQVPGQRHLPEADGRLWLLTGAGDQLTGIKSGYRVGAQIPLGTTCADLGGSGRTVWAACPDTGLLMKVDVRTRRVTGQLPLAGARTVVVGRDVWVGFTGGVAQVDARALTVVAVYTVDPGGNGGIAVSPRRVWVSAADNPVLTEIDPAKHKILRTVSTKTPTRGGDVAVAGNRVWTTAAGTGLLIGVRSR